MTTKRTRPSQAAITEKRMLVLARRAQDSVCHEARYARYGCYTDTDVAEDKFYRACVRTLIEKLKAKATATDVVATIVARHAKRGFRR